jgi:putative acetyltransferase
MPDAPLEIREDDLSSPLTRDLIRLHLDGMTRLSLETGSGIVFEPALALYRRRGFVDGEAFAQYVRSPFNQFLHLEL